MIYKNRAGYVSFFLYQNSRAVFLQEHADHLTEKIQQLDKSNDEKESVTKEEDITNLAKSIEDIASHMSVDDKQEAIKNVEDLLSARQKELSEVKNITDQKLQKVVDETVMSLEQFEQQAIALRKEKIDARLAEIVEKGQDPNIQFPEFKQGQGLVKTSGSETALLAEINKISFDENGNSIFYLKDRSGKVTPPIPTGNYTETDLQNLINQHQLILKEKTDNQSASVPSRAETLIIEQTQLTNQLFQLDLIEKMKDPAVKKNITILTALQKRKEDLAGQIMQQLLSQKQFEEQNSASRSLSQGALRNLLDRIMSGDNDLSNLADSQHKREIERLSAQTTAVEQAIVDISSGKEISVPDKSIDPVIYAMKNYQDSEKDDYDVKRDFSDQAEYMEEAYKNGNNAEVGLIFDAMATKYLEKQTNGQSFNRNADGSLSLTGAINQLIKLGKIDNNGQPVLKAEDLGSLKDQISKNYLAIIQAIDKSKFGGGIYAKDYKPTLPSGLLEQEAARLSQIEKHPDMQALQNPLNKALDVFKQIPKDALWKEITKEIILLLDDPVTYAMIIIGIATEGLGTVGMIGSLAAKCPKLVSILSKLEKAKRAHQIMRFILSSALDGAVFHTGLNMFHELSGRGDEANWGIGGYANSMALFGVGKAVHLAHGKLASKLPGMTTTVQRTVATRFGKEVVEKQVQTLTNKGLLFSEELLAFGGLGVIQTYLISGDIDQAIDIMKHNFEFLVAMRVVHYGQNKLLVDKELHVRALEKQARSQPNNQTIKEAWIKSYAEYIKSLNEMQEASYRKGMTKNKATTVELPSESDSKAFEQEIEEIRLSEKVTPEVSRIGKLSLEQRTAEMENFLGKSLTKEQKEWIQQVHTPGNLLYQQIGEAIGEHKMFRKIRETMKMLACTKRQAVDLIKKGYLGSAPESYAETLKPMQINPETRLNVGDIINVYNAEGKLYQYKIHTTWASGPLAGKRGVTCIKSPNPEEVGKRGVMKSEIKEGQPFLYGPPSDSPISSGAVDKIIIETKVIEVSTLEIGEQIIIKDTKDNFHHYAVVDKNQNMATLKCFNASKETEIGGYLKIDRLDTNEFIENTMIMPVSFAIYPATENIRLEAGFLHFADLYKKSNFYERLGLDAQTNNPEIINKAFSKISQMLYNLPSSGTASTKLILSALNEAYLTLRNTEAKQKYDNEQLRWTDFDTLENLTSLSSKSERSSDSSERIKQEQKPIAKSKTENEEPVKSEEKDKSQAQDQSADVKKTEQSVKPEIKPEMPTEQSLLVAEKPLKIGDCFTVKNANHYYVFEVFYSTEPETPLRVSCIRSSDPKMNDDNYFRVPVDITSSINMGEDFILRGKNNEVITIQKLEKAFQGFPKQEDMIMSTGTEQIQNKIVLKDGVLVMGTRDIIRITEFDEQTGKEEIHVFQLDNNHMGGPASTLRVLESPRLDKGARFRLGTLKEGEGFQLSGKFPYRGKDAIKFIKNIELITTGQEVNYNAQKALNEQIESSEPAKKVSEEEMSSSAP